MKQLDPATMTLLHRASDKISTVRMVIAKVGIATTVKLEASRLIYRLGLSRMWPIFSVSLPNSKHKVNLRTGTSDYNVFLHVFVFETYADCVAPGSSSKLIIDCGANVGCSGVYFLHRFPEAKLVAVEPDPSNAAMCEINLAPFRNRAVLWKCAVWSNEGELELVRSGRHSEQSTKVRVSTGSGPVVNGIDMAGLVSLAGGGPVDLLKLDIEGAEARVFARNVERWLPAIRNIAIELHGPDCEQKFFEGLSGYEYELLRFLDTTICRNITRRNESITAETCTSDCTSSQIA